MLKTSKIQAKLLALIPVLQEYKAYFFCKSQMRLVVLPVSTKTAHYLVNLEQSLKSDLEEGLITTSPKFEIFINFSKQDVDLAGIPISKSMLSKSLTD